MDAKIICKSAQGKSNLRIVMADAGSDNILAIADGPLSVRR